MYYRNSIVKLFRQNPSSKIIFTGVRKTLVGDVGSIRRVFDSLDAWGLINYSPSASLKPFRWEDKESKSTPSQASSADGSAATAAANSAATPGKDTAKRYCSGCKSVCGIACFACDKAALLSALAGEDVAEAAVLALTEVEYGGSKGNLLSFAQDTGPLGIMAADLGTRNKKSKCPDTEKGYSFCNILSLGADSGASHNADSNLSAPERACLDANSRLEDKELEVERAISRIVDVQMKEIQDKIAHFDELDLQMDKE